MKNFYIYCLLLLATITSCSRDMIDPIPGEGAGPMVITFGSSANASVITRGTLDDLAENRVWNIYLAVFDGAGKKVYAHYFDATNQKNDKEQVTESNDPCWSVVNTTEDATSRTTGHIKVALPVGTGYKIYAIANLDADMVNVSSDRLGAEIHAESDMLGFVATLNQDVISRNGYFPMSGMVRDVAVASGGAITAGGKTANLSLCRLDAKVRFIFKTGNPSDPDKQKIKLFSPEQWQVINVPRKSYAMSYADRGISDAAGQDASANAADFFSSDLAQFEDVIDSKTKGFSFYMLENRMPPKKRATEYTDRDRQEKLPSGLNGKWEYANDLSTFVVVYGRVHMELEGDDAGQILGAEVRYIIHLGDFGTDVADFFTRRNTSYTYTVTVTGVDNIRVEVTTETKENQPGGVGNVTIAKEEIAYCDAHYVAKTLTFHAKYVADDLTWHVKTPFCDGKPEIIDGEDVPTGLDYKWCQFRLNEKDGMGLYSANRRAYTPDAYHAETNPEGEMDVIAFVKYIKKQKRLFDDPLLRPTSDFDNTPEEEGGPKIRVTVHVDEYYYDEHPITGERSPMLWKEFVNRSDRMMHILCDSEVSKDQESRITGSVVTVEQRAIQSIYDTRLANTSLETAWGMEHEDEYPDIWIYGNDPGNWNRGNEDLYNGRLNTMKEWGLVGRDGGPFQETDWSTYMKVDVNNDTPLLNDKYRTLRYSCMTRNRDNNGDGKINQDEVRWYLASIRQLVGVWIGADVVDHDGRLYNRTPEDMQSTNPDKWRQHIVSSTSFEKNSNNPTVVWGEEGSSTSHITGSVDWGKVTKWSVRCVRNLGTRNENLSTGYNLKEQPTDYVTMTRNGDGTYTFENTHLNRETMRYYTSRELDFDGGLSEQNLVYKKFQVAEDNVNTNEFPNNENSFVKVNNRVTAASTNPYCPPGYRLPNQRELTLMMYYLPPGTLKDPCISRTYYTRGIFGDNHDKKPEDPTNPDKWKTGYIYNTNIALAKQEDNYGATYVRCVRDIRTDD